MKQRERRNVTDKAKYREEFMRMGKLVAHELIKRTDEPEYETSQSPYDAAEPERAEPVATV